MPPARGGALGVTRSDPTTVWMKMEMTQHEAIDMALLVLEDCPGLRADLEGLIATRLQAVAQLVGVLDVVGHQCREYPNDSVRTALPHSRLAKDPFALMKNGDLAW